MSRTARLVVFLVGAGCLGAMMVLAFLDLPSVGSTFHPYRDRAVAAAVAQRTSNVVASVNFDLRGLDTLGEETIFFTSVIGAAVLLRPAAGERKRRSPEGRTLEAVRLAGYLLLPVTLLVGVDVVTHGQVTPGGGFQGGLVLGTGLHLLYVTGSFGALERLRPVAAFELGEVAGAAAFAGLGVAGIAVGGSFLANVVPLGQFGQLFSAGTVPILNDVVGLEVGSGVMLLLASFLQQALVLVPEEDGEDGEGRAGGPAASRR